MRKLIAFLLLSLFSISGYAEVEITKLLKHPEVLVAASNASAKEKATADYICDGTSLTGGDQIEIQMAIEKAADPDGDGVYGEAGEGGIVRLSSGDFFTLSQQAKPHGQARVQPQQLVVLLSLQLHHGMVLIV